MYDHPIGQYLHEPRQDMRTFGGRLAWAIYSRGITQTMFAYDTGKSQAGLSQYMRGRNSPSIDNVILFADTLDLTKDELYWLCLMTDDMPPEMQKRINQQSAIPPP